MTMTLSSPTPPGNTCDLLVIGSGAGALSAAVTAADSAPAPEPMTSRSQLLSGVVWVDMGHPLCQSA